MNARASSRATQAGMHAPWHVDQDDRPGMAWNRHISMLALTDSLAGADSTMGEQL